MQKITLLSVGKIKIPWVREACTMYIDRLSHHCRFTHQVVPSGEVSEECDRLAFVLSKIEGAIVILDERGKDFTSEQFARWVGVKRDGGIPITFLLGGAYGLDDRIRAKATMVLRLSSMTMTHEFAQMFFLEQAYRAFEILRGSGYHH